MMERLAGLDMLRGVAAIIVLVMHIAGFSGGHLAVDFFFMLSGYVMARTYEQRLRDGEISAARFIVMRFRRLWPVMAIGAAIGLNIAIVASGFSFDLLFAFLFAMLLLPGSASIPYFLNLPAWSIFYELLANALHGAWFARLDNIAAAGLLALLSIVFLASFAFVGFPRILGQTTIEMQLLVVFRALVSYVIGILAFRLMRDEAPIRVPLTVGLVALPGYIAFVSLANFPLWPVPFVYVVAPLILFAGLDRSAPKRLSHALGTISFPLYATHFPIISAAAMAGLSGRAAMIISLAVASLWLLPGFAQSPRRSRSPAF